MLFARVFLSLGAMWLMAGVASWAPASERPNILFIYTDDQAPTAIGLDNPELKTPNIDRLFGQGVRLTNAFVATPVCSPARAEVMASRYGSEVGIFDWINPRQETEHGLDPSIVIWPELLAAAGYRTGLVGKWHLGTADRYEPRQRGFKHFVGFRSGGTSPIDPTLEVNGQMQKFKGYTTDILTDQAMDFLRSKQEGPFLLCLHYRAPHAPWLPAPPEDTAPYADLDPQIPNPDFPNLDTAKIKRMTREYYASVSGVDRNVGRLMKLLDERKLTENTLVIFTSDHGYHLGHHALWYKGNAQRQLTKLPPQRWPHIGARHRPNLLDQSLRVATAVRWPATIKAGTTLDQTISNLDWFPTLLAVAQVKLPENLVIRGKNFAPLLKGESIPWENDFYSEYSMKHGAQTHMRSWRTEKWKLMIDFLNPGRVELYDLVNDPGETTNLADSPKAEPQRMKKLLTTKIVAKMAELNDPATP